MVGANILVNLSVKVYPKIVLLISGCRIFIISILVLVTQRGKKPNIFTTTAYLQVVLLLC